MVMHLRVARVLSFCVVLWHWCDGQRIPEEFQKYNISPPNTFGRESSTNKTIDQLIVEAMGDLKGALNLKSKSGDILVELDMLLSKEQYYSLYEQSNSSSLIRSKRKAIRNPFNRWTKGEIPYRFYPGEFRQDHQKGIRQSMTEWERYTCLRFREATSSDFNAIVFRDKIGCYSYVGMQGGQQEVSLSSDGCRYTQAYLHEIGHAIGLVHEHSRPDRDDYVEILRENVEPRLWYNFEKETPMFVDQMNVSYDYSSIMHYGAYAGSKNGKKTIRVKFPEKAASIGEASILSFTDVEIVNKMYRCHAKCDPSIKCSGGYVDENCRCVCKNGFQDCQIGGGVKPSGNTCGVNTNGDSWKCFVKAQHGECEANPTLMNRECARACGPCGLKRKPGTCAKMYPSDKCLKWSRNGDCLTNKEWMNNYCCGTCVNSNNEKTTRPRSTTKLTTKKSIGECANLHNDNRLCDAWAKAGNCKTNQFVAINCAKSCGNCSDPGPSTSSNDIRLANILVKTSTEQSLINKVNEQAPADDPNGGCIDEKDTCVIWARYGFCKNNRDQAVIFCPKTCNLCDQRQGLLLR